MKFKKFFILLIALFSFSNFCIFAQNSTAGSVASDNNQDQVVESSDNVEENYVNYIDIDDIDILKIIYICNEYCLEF